MIIESFPRQDGTAEVAFLTNKIAIFMGRLEGIIYESCVFVRKQNDVTRTELFSQGF